MRATLALAAALAAAACGGERPTSPDAAPAWSLAAEPAMVIGEAEGDPSRLFERIAGVRLLPDGGVAVADGGFANVRVFGPTGGLRAAMGGEGEGPGEFEYVSTLLVHPPDTLVVYDSGLFRLTAFSMAGDILGTRSLEADDGRPELHLGRFTDGDLGFAWIVQGPRAGGAPSPDPMRLGRFGEDGSLEAELGSAQGMVRSLSEAWTGPLPFSPFFHAFVLVDSVYVTDGVEIMRVLGPDGAAARTIELPENGLGEEAGREALAARLAALDRPDDIRRLDEVERVGVVPDVAAVLVDDRGRLWMKAYDPGDDSLWLRPPSGAAGGRWWVVERDGRLVGRIDLPSGFTPMDVREDRIAGVLRDEMGVERVAVFGYAMG